MKPTARRRLGKYVLLGRIGHGGMGKIYLAYAPGPAGIEKLLVVKRLHSHLTTDQVLVNSFLDEARLSMALSDPHIVSTFDVGEVDGRFFMVMEYIDGQNLGVVLRTAKRTGRYPSSALWAGLFLDVLDGLQAAHNARDARGRPLHIIHRDVSPQNILITYEGVPKLVDFGIAKAAMRVSETDAGVLKGKYAYMSPEQVRGEPLDARSDLFAAGIVLWEMLAGRRLYKADTIVRSVERILTEQPISPVRVNSECDPDIAKVAFKALQKDREDRFASAAHFKEALEDALQKASLRPRRADARELMQRLFGDVIEQQRAVLEACLTAGDAPAADGDDDDDGARGKPGSDSESDVSLQHLRREEATTPSARRASPLVTADGERGGERAQTSPGRRRARAEGAAAARPDEAPPAPPAQPAELALVATPEQELWPARAQAFSATEATATTETEETARRRRWRPLAAAALLVVLASGALGVWYARSRGAERRLSTLEQSQAAPQPAPAVVEPTPVAVPALPATPSQAATPASLEPAGTDAASSPDAGPSSAASDAGSAVEVEPQPKPARERARPKPATREVKQPLARGVAAEQDPRPNERPSDKSADRGAGKADELAASVAPGLLSLDTAPWTTVYFGTKKLGETPLVDVPLPAGSLELTLVNSEAGIKESYLVKMRTGQPTKVRLDLN